MFAFAKARRLTAGDGNVHGRFTPDPYEPKGWGEIGAVIFLSVLIFLPAGIAIVVWKCSRPEGSARAVWKDVARMLGNVAHPSRAAMQDLEAIGVEGAAVLLFERELGRILFSLGLAVNLVLAPIHLAFGQSHSLFDFTAVTIQNLPNSGHQSPVLWVHIVFVWAISLVIIVHIDAAKKSLRRFEHLSRTPASSNSSCFVSHPRIKLSGPVLMQALNLVMNKPVHGVNVMDQPGLKAIVTWEDAKDAKTFCNRTTRLNLIKARLKALLQQTVHVESTSLLAGEAVAGDDGDTLKNLHFLQDEARVQEWSVMPAPNPGDIIWDAAYIDPKVIVCRSVITNSLLVVILVLFTTPVALISLVGQGFSPNYRSGLSELYSSMVANLRQLSTWWSEFIFGFLPQLVLVVFDAWLLFFLQFISKNLEPHTTFSGREKLVLYKSFFFLVFNTLILPSLALSTVQAFFDHLAQSKSPFIMLGRAFAISSGAFTLTFVATQTWVGAFMDLTRFSERLWWMCCQKRRSSTLSRFEFDLGSEYAIALTVFSLCVVFATVLPPILFFGGVYFVVKAGVDEFSLVHVVTRQPIDKSPLAHVGLAALRLLWVSVILLQVTIIGFFASSLCVSENAGFTGVHCVSPDGTPGVEIQRGDSFQLVCLGIALGGTILGSVVDLAGVDIRWAVGGDAPEQRWAAHKRRDDVVEDAADADAGADVESATARRPGEEMSRFLE